MVNKTEIIVISKDELSELINSILDKFVERLQPVKKEIERTKPPIYLSREEVSKIFKITFPTLKKHTESGLLKVHYIGRRVLYDQNELSKVFETVEKVINKYKDRRKF